MTATPSCAVFHLGGVTVKLLHLVLLGAPGSDDDGVFDVATSLRASYWGHWFLVVVKEVLYDGGPAKLVEWI